MADGWPEIESQIPKTQPWILFGVALIVCVASLLFAAGTWIVRSDQVARARRSQSQVEGSLEAAQRSLAEAAEREEQLIASSEKLQGDSASVRDQLVEARRREADLQVRLDAAEAELGSTRRDLDAQKSTVAEDRRRDAMPAGLPRSSLREALGACDDVVALVTVQQQAGLLSEGALREHLRQQGLGKCGFGYSDSGGTRLLLSVVAAEDVAARQVGLSVHLEVGKIWKVPGEFKSSYAVLWNRHSAGLCGMDRTPGFVEELVADLVDALAEEIKE